MLNSFFKNRRVSQQDLFSQHGIRYPSYKTSISTIIQLRKHWQKFAKHITKYPNIFEGKGIVICAGGLQYFTCAWINIHILRKHKCELPIEVWYVDNELSDEIIEELKNLNVECRNCKNYTKEKLKSYAIKPFAILNSKFKEILLLDADINCINDPSYLFDSIEYKINGAVFWPDFWLTSKDNPIWKIIRSKDYNILEQESGQILINKERCWKELNLCMYFNHHSDYYYKFLHGDKDTFKFAWTALKSPFHMITYDVGTCGRTDDNNNFIGMTMVQHDFRGQILFLHRNLLKWDITGNNEIVWKEIKRFKEDTKDKKIITRYFPKYGHLAMDIQGDIERLDFVHLFGKYELNCLEILQHLRETHFYKRFLLYAHFFRSRGDSIDVKNLIQ